MVDYNQDLSQFQKSFILNDIPYYDLNLFSEGTGTALADGAEGLFSGKTGIAVTITIPPTLMAFKFPNLIRGFGTPYVSQDDRTEIFNRTLWYNSARQQQVAKINFLNRQIRAATARLRKYERENNQVKINQTKAEITRLRKRLSELQTAQKTSPGLLNQYSTEFELSSFITSLSWSCSTNNITEVSIELDNIKGLFNFLPEAAKITIWRRKTIVSGRNSLFGGKWYRYITAYVATRSRTMAARSNTLSLTCYDRAGFLEAQVSKKTTPWAANRTNRKGGWTPRDITIDVCKREGIPYDPKKLPKFITVKKLIKTSNGRTVTSYVKVALPKIVYEPNELNLVNLISGAWNQSLEKLPANQRLPYAMHMRRGVLEVEFIAPPGEPLTQTDPQGQRFLATFDDNNIEGATFEDSIDPDQVFTQLTASGTYNDGWKINSKGRRVRRTKPVRGVFFPSGDRGKTILQAYGKRNKTKAFKTPFNNKKEFRTAAQSHIDRISRPIRKIQFDARAPLGIWPVNYVRVSSRELGINKNVMVENISYSVEAGTIKASIALKADYTYYSTSTANYNYPEAETSIWY